MIDYLQNKSEINYEALTDIWKQITNIIMQQPMQEPWKQEQIMLHHTVFSILMSTFFNQHLLVVGDSFTNGLITQYAKLLRTENTVFAIEQSMLQNTSAPGNLRTNPQTKPQMNIQTIIHDLKAENYSIIVIPYELADLITENVQDMTGYLVTYHVPKLYVQTKRFEGQNPVQKPLVYQVIVQKVNLIIDAFDQASALTKGQTNPYLITEEDTDHLIRLVQDAEDYACANYQVLGIENLKDELNDLKNALLDYRYGTDQPFFFQVVLDQISHFR